MPPGGKIKVLHPNLHRFLLVWDSYIIYHANLRVLIVKWEMINNSLECQAGNESCREQTHPGGESDSDTESVNAGLIQMLEGLILSFPSVGLPGKL